MQYLATLFLEAVLVIVASSHPARPTLPLCSEVQSAEYGRELHCVVRKGEHLDYDQIRTYTKDLDVADKVNVSINCIDGGVIRLPWPFVAKNVVSLHVAGCINEGLFSERKIRQPYRNELKKVVIINIQQRLTISELHDYTVNFHNMSKEYICGSTNAEVQIFKNIHYVFKGSIGSFEELIMMQELFEAADNLISSSPSCSFPHLRYMESSGSRSFSTHHLKLFESNQYPNLEAYSLSNNSLGKLPAELEFLHLNFLPKLRYLDLSSNDLTSADFTFRGKLVNNIKLLINLRKNMIRTLSQRLVEDIKTTGVILDVRDNPLECSCSLSSYGKYLSKLKSNAATEVLKEAKCRDDEAGNQKYHTLTDIEMEIKHCVTIL